ncbi:22114_t:CDS:2 [Gigaspora margarita]|uniref:22114_t:CDS:1 n=1 Tax=Gigaspora margarita TaxID=4874 RepID=A0ABN7UJE8_GIGMA|nr:22114_t:CDS:2 [Gigaspora margarita]
MTGLKLILFPKEAAISTRGKIHMQIEKSMPSVVGFSTQTHACAQQKTWAWQGMHMCTDTYIGKGIGTPLKWRESESMSG